MDWDDVRHFLALARHGSVRAAGAALGVSHSTVARRVEALEERLQTRLFDRSRDGYTLTTAGEQMRPRAERIESELAALDRDLTGRDERLAGRVALTCCDAWVSALVVRELAVFCGEYPDIDLALVNDSRSFDLTRREADLALRILARDTSPPEHLIATKLLPITVANYVGLSCEAGGRWVAFADDDGTLPAMIAGSSYPQLPLWGAFTGLSPMVQAISEGLGMGMLPTYVGDAEPSLQRAAQADVRHVADLWLLCHPDLRDNARIRAVRHRLRDALRQQQDLFAGARPAHGTSRPTIAPG